MMRLRGGLRWVSLTVIGLVAFGCGAHAPSAVDRAEFRYWVKQPYHHTITGLTCDQYGSITVSQKTYTGYNCTMHGGGHPRDGSISRAYWDGHKQLSFNQLPYPAQNQLGGD